MRWGPSLPRCTVGAHNRVPVCTDPASDLTAQGPGSGGTATASPRPARTLPRQPRICCHLKAVSAWREQGLSVVRRKQPPSPRPNSVEETGEWAPARTSCVAVGRGAASAPVSAPASWQLCGQRATGALGERRQSRGQESASSRCRRTGLSGRPARPGVGERQESEVGPELPFLFSLPAPCWLLNYKSDTKTRDTC